METETTERFGRFGWASRIAARLMTEAGRVGVDPSESGDAALQRRLLVVMSVGTLPLTVLWSVIYFAAGAPLAAAAPAVYSIVTPINTALLALDPQFRPLPLHPAAHDAGAALAGDDEPGRLQELERGDHLGGALSARLAAGRGSAPDLAVDRGLRPAPDRERAFCSHRSTPPNCRRHSSPGSLCSISAR